MKRKSFFVLLIFLSGLAFANEIENFRKQMRDIPGSDNIDDIAIVEPYEPEESHEYEVAQKKPNGYGLFDMSGNVSEWVMDVYEEELNYTCGACFASGYSEGFEITDCGYGSRRYGRGDIGIRLLRVKTKGK